MKPEFITFTGADDQTDIWEMKALANQYPIEWGVLLSPKRQGVDPRFPTEKTVAGFLWNGLTLSAHLCGDYSDEIMDFGGQPNRLPVDLSAFSRMQVNHIAPEPREIVAYARSWGTLRGVAQLRDDTFPIDNTVDWLFDRSGGRGSVPDTWPVHPGGGRRVGYAGGIGPDNVVEVLFAIGATGPHWIDMESGVRTDNRFDLAKCRAVCERVYGAAS